MAKGDTKTNQYLDIAANGTRADLPTDTCCETRSQTLIREVAERIITEEETRAREDAILQGEIDEIKNSPDVVDIVDTYADLQAYSTSGLTDKDIIRVIADETKGGLSSYYRWNSPNPGWNFIGVIPGGDGIKELSSADYNYPTANPDRVALWLLDNGLYTAPAGVMVAASTTSYPWYNTSDKTILVGGSDTVKGIYTFLNGKTDVVTTQVSDGTEADEYTLLKSTQVLQATGQSTTDTMSQKAITDAIAGGGGGGTNNFNQLTNRPEYDGVTMTGDTSIPKVPTATSELTNDSDFITSSALPTVNDAILTITQNGTSKGTFTANDADDTTIALTDTTYNAGSGLDLTDTEFSVDTTTIQPKLTAGSNITIDSDNEISATDTTYSNFVGTDGAAAGTAGLVPAPATTDAGKFLKADGTWDMAGSAVNIVQTTGTSQTDVMSQNAVTVALATKQDTAIISNNTLYL